MGGERGRRSIASVRQSRVPELIRLAYVSAAVDGLTQADLEAIAETSRIRNRRAGLTGFLITQGGRFHGVLEGPQRVLFTRMEAIVTDSRHRNLVVVREDSVNQRRFQNWSFGALPDSVPSTGGDASAEFLRNLTTRM